MAVRLTVVEGPSTSRKIRVRVGSVPIRFFSRDRDHAARVYANLIFQTSIPTVACPSHLTMLSECSVFIIIFGLFSRRRLGLKLPKYGLGAPPRRSRRRRSRHHLFPPFLRTAWSPRLLTALSIALRYLLKNVLPPYFTIMYFRQTHIDRCM